MSKSRNDVESFGIQAVSGVLRKAEHLSPQLNEIERSKGYDGFISIVKNPSDKIEDEIGRVYVQVKTRTVKKKQIQKKISYSLSAKRIRHYQRIHPLVFFVVHRFEDESSCIYYKNLQKTDLFDLLERNEDPVHFELELLEKTHSELDNMFLHFFQESKIQEMMKPENRVNIVDCVVNGYKAHFIAPSFHPDKKGLFERVNRDDAILFFEKDNVLYHNNSGVPKLLSIKTRFDCNLLVDRTVYFSKAEAEYTGKRVSFQFGDSLQISVGVGEDRSVNFNYNLKDYLHSLIPTMRFILALSEKKKCRIEWGGENIDCNLNALPDGLISYCKEWLPIYEKIQQMLSYFRIDSDLDISKIKSREYDVACQVYDAFVKGTEIEIKNQNKDSVLLYMDFGELKLAFLGIRQESGKYKVFDELGKEERLNTVYMRDEEIHLVPVETCFNDTAIWSCNNFNQKIYLSVLRKLLANDSALASITNDNDFLNILREFDKNKKASLLELALSVNSLLKEFCSELLGTTLIELNRLQVVKRQRLFTEEEKNTLIDLLASEELPANKVAILLLLDRKDVAKTVFEKMSADERESFMSYPISVFFS